MSTCVYFFGGYQASETDVKTWQGNARAQRSDVQFTAFAWPSGAASGANSAITGFKKSGQYASAVAAIGSSTADRVYLVGHSSGCAIANAVDRELSDHSKIVLVALDGFGPDQKQLARMSTQVWAAECGGEVSLHYNTLKKYVGGRLRVYKATNSKSLWALHFSLVNAAANDMAVTSIATGYAECRANLAWLKP